MIVTQTHTETQLQSKGFKNRVDIYDGHFNPRMARFHGVDQVDEERVQLTKLEDMNNGILRYLSEEVPTGNADRVCSCAEILQITNHLEEMRRILQKEFQHNADRLYSQGKPTLKERLQHSVHELTDAISVYHQMAKEVPKTISATPSPITPDLNLSNSMINVNTADNAGFLLSPSFSNTPPIVPPVLLVEHKEKINFCPRCGTSLSQSPPSTVPAVICGTSPAFSKMGDMNWKHPDYSSACTIIICPSCAWKASNKTDEPEKDRNAFLLTASAPLYDWNTGDTSNYWCI